MMTKEAFDKLRSKLSRGYGKELAARTGKSESAVYQALTGDINSPEIIKAAIQLAKEQADQSNDIANQIDNL